ncbi:putative membrane protein, partial [Clostridioides difficile CD196]
MNFRNIYLILMGLGIIILTTIISLIEIKIGFC